MHDHGKTRQVYQDTVANRKRMGRSPKKAPVAKKRKQARATKFGLRFRVRNIDTNQEVPASIIPDDVKLKLAWFIFNGVPQEFTYHGDHVVQMNKPTFTVDGIVSKGQVVFDSASMTYDTASDELRSIIDVLDEKGIWQVQFEDGNHEIHGSDGRKYAFSSVQLI